MRPNTNCVRNSILFPKRETVIRESNGTKTVCSDWLLFVYLNYRLNVKTRTRIVILAQM